MLVDPQESRNSASLANDQTRKTPALRREVLSPASQSTGVGVMLVASAAMFFAVASSAFILRSQTGQSCPSQSTTIQRLSIDEPMGIEVISISILDSDLSDEGLSSCGTPVIQEADGRSDVIFQLCPTE